MKRTVTEATKKQIAGRQSFKCANKPGNILSGIKNYQCSEEGNEDIGK